MYKSNSEPWCKLGNLDDYDVSCSFIKGTTLMGDTDNGGARAFVGTGGIREISVPFTQFCWELIKTALKNSRLKNNLPHQITQSWLEKELITQNYG